jgi:hypothetical protein
VHQAKYTKDIVKKFKMDDAEPMSTLMSTTTVLDADEDEEPMDQKEYRSKIWSLLYLKTTRPDIQFSVCLCTHFSGDAEDFASTSRQDDFQVFEQNS